MIRRPPRSTLDRSSAASDVYKRQVDWEAVKTDYLKMLEGAANRNDVSFIIGEMIGELNASHTYNSGCLLYTSPSPRDRTRSRMPSSA